VRPIKSIEEFRSNASTTGFLHRESRSTERVVEESGRTTIHVSTYGKIVTAHSTQHAIARSLAEREELGRPEVPRRRLLSQLRGLRVVPFKANVGVELKGVRSGVERRRGVCVGIETVGWEEKRARVKSLRIGVHIAAAVVRGPA
jgi:hypothetical protein